MELKGHDFDNQDMRDFVEKWNYIDNQRLGIDSEINAILKGLDLTELFKELKRGGKESIQNSQLIKDLLMKIQKRREELEAEE